MRGLGRWPGYAALNRPLTVLGVERRLFLLGATLAVAVWNATASLVAGGAVFAGCYGAGWLAGPQGPGYARGASRGRSLPGPVRSGQVGRRAVAPEDPGARGVRVAEELRAYEAAGSLAEELPYWGWLDDDRTCLTRSGELLAAGRIRTRSDGRPHARADRPRAWPLAAAAVGTRLRHAPPIPYAPAPQPRRGSRDKRFGRRLLVRAPAPLLPRRARPTARRLCGVVAQSGPPDGREESRTGTAVAAQATSEARRQDGNDLLGLGDRGGRGPVPGDDRRGPLARRRAHARRVARRARRIGASLRFDQPTRHVLGRSDGQRHELAARAVGTRSRAVAPEARRRAGGSLLAPVAARPSAREPPPRAVLPGRRDDHLTRMAAVDGGSGAAPDPKRAAPLLLPALLHDGARAGRPRHGGRHGRFRSGRRVGPAGSGAGRTRSRRRGLRRGFADRGAAR